MMSLLPMMVWNILQYMYGAACWHHIYMERGKLGCIQWNLFGTDQSVLNFYEVSSFQGLSIHIWHLESVLFIEVSLIPRCSYREIPL